ncbi:MAG: serine hydrolase domain-containing protein [Polyangia bacterium]
MRKRLTTLLEGALRDGVADRVFPGAQAAVWARGGLLAGATAGVTRPDAGEPVETDTRFDLASLTKPFVASAVLRMVDRCLVDLELRVCEALREFGCRSTGRATLAELLAHESGLPAWKPLYQRIDPDLRGTEEGRRVSLEMIAKIETDRAPGSSLEYSDLGYVLLGEIAARLAGCELPELLKREVLEPLDLTTIGFRPARPTKRGEVILAATEDCPWRGRLLEGEVHDDNAWAMNGAAGHAGLFGTAEDVARFGGAWLSALADGAWLSRDLSRNAVKRRPLGRALWGDLVSPKGSMAGSEAGPRTFGHLGFTGCSLWVDPDREAAIALATNRVCPSRDNTLIRGFRPEFQDEIWKALD